MSYELDQAQRELDKAADTFETEKKKHYRPDGTAKYSPAELKEREAAIFAPVQEAADRARQAAKEGKEQAEQEALVSDFNPLLALAGKNSDLVMVKQNIITADVEASTLPELARRVAAVAAHGDEIDRRLYALHVGKRVETLMRQAQRTGQTEQGFSEVAGALRKLRETLVDPATARKIEAAQAKREKAQKLEIYAIKTVNDATGKTEQNRREYAQRVRSF